MVEPILIVSIIIACISFLVAIIAIILVFVRPSSEGTPGPQGPRGLQGATGSPGIAGGEATLAVMTQIGDIVLSGNTLTNMTPEPTAITGTLFIPINQLVVGATFRITLGGYYRLKQLDNLRFFITNDFNGTQIISSGFQIPLGSANTEIDFKFEVILVIKQLGSNNTASVSSISRFNNGTAFFKNSTTFNTNLGLDLNLFGQFTNTTTSMLYMNIFILERLF